jgi:DNA-binding transcriptional LysR family regulator
MELRQLRYFVAIGEEQHYGRASLRLRVAQPALSRQIQNLEKEIGFKLFERLPRGVKLSTAGKHFLEDARRILKETGESVMRAARVARGQSGTLRVGFPEDALWHSMVPQSFRRFREMRPEIELELQPIPSLEQLEAIRSERLDAGFIHNMPRGDAELGRLLVAMNRFELAVPTGHPFTKIAGLRVRDLTNTPFVWWPRRLHPILYDRLMHECFRRGLQSPRIVQEGQDEATVLGLVATGLGVGWVLGTARRRRAKGIIILSVVDMRLTVPLALAWRKDNRSPLLGNFVNSVQDFAETHNPRGPRG